MWNYLAVKILRPTLGPQLRGGQGIAGQEPGQLLGICKNGLAIRTYNRMSGVCYASDRESVICRVMVLLHPVITWKRLGYITSYARVVGGSGQVRFRPLVPEERVRTRRLGVEQAKVVERKWTRRDRSSRRESDYRACTNRYKFLRKPTT